MLIGNGSLTSEIRKTLKKSNLNYKILNKVNNKKLQIL